MTKKLQQNLAAVLIFIVLFVFAYYKYLIGPLGQKHQATSDQLAQTETKLASLKQRAKELPKLQGEMKQLEADVAELGKRLPKEKGIQELLRIITKEAQNYHLNILTFSPSPVVEKSNYYEIPFQLSVKGTYHTLAQFLADLGQEYRIISSRNITMNAETASKNSTITANFTIVAFTYKG